MHYKKNADNFYWLTAAFEATVIYPASTVMEQKASLVFMFLYQVNITYSKMVPLGEMLYSKQ